MNELTLARKQDELRAKFFALTNPQDIADLLEIDLSRLYYHLYRVDESSRYITFQIPKRRGGIRTISAPATALKIIQRKLSQILLQVYVPKPAVHGFVLNRSILTNAKVHVGRRNILNIDLENFFPSINFGRVRGLFMGVPYKFDPKVATILAQICCNNNELPQGAPTSPIITNMICAKMDSELMKLAKITKSDYSRYADDITFSTNLRKLPSSLAILNDLGQIEIGSEFKKIIENNGFKVNSKKTRIKPKSLRQEVTGITINKFPNVRRRFVRQIRAMLHAWDKFGLDAAQAEFLKKYDRKSRSPWTNKPSFKKVVKGKIEFLGMVRGKTDPIYVTLCAQLQSLSPDLVKSPERRAKKSKTSKPVRLHLLTEGKTDWKHLEYAHQKLLDLGHKFTFVIEFNKNESEMGASELLKSCKLEAKISKPVPMVFVFDRDKLDTIKEAVDDANGYKNWGNGTYSFAIPVPTHRRDTPNISIEFYYKDEEIKRQDNNGRRLYLSNEFQPWGKHKNLPLICNELNKIKDPNISIIDSKVFDDNGNSLALSKDDYVENIRNQKKGFDDFDFTEFTNIFNILTKISKSLKS